MSHSVRNCSEPENVSNTWLAALPEAKIGVGRLQTLQPPSFSGAHLPDYHWDSWYVCQNKANRWAVVADVYSGSFEATSERYGSKYGEAQCKWGSLYVEWLKRQFMFLWRIKRVGKVWSFNSLCFVTQAISPKVTAPFPPKKNQYTTIKQRYCFR